MGCDNQLQRGQSVPIRISIHAPQWGATWTCATSRAMMVYFNPRTPVGCDRASTGIAEAGMYFNPRTPVGCDSPPTHVPNSPYNFNPRTPVGCDFDKHSPRSKAQNFNPRTPVGCDTELNFSYGGRDGISIHAPQWGATWEPATCRYSPRYFNPRTPVGCDYRRGHAPAHGRDFNPRTPVGCDI